MTATQALESWAARLGPGSVLGPQEAAQRYGLTTDTRTRTMAGAVVPAAASDVADIVRIAHATGVPLYPISLGHNWGYGDSVPPVEGCAVLDLRRLKGIELDEDLALVTVEPGVSQEDLARFLEERGVPLMVPTTGGGPRCSLVGNACERGYGITPIQDHFAAVMAIEAVLPSGELYRTPLSELGAVAADRAFKWGVGPYVDGLLTQSSVAVITRMTFALAPRSGGMRGFSFSVPGDRDLEAVVTAVRQLLRACGSTVGGLNLMNSRRVLAMSSSYPAEIAGTGQVMSQPLVERLAGAMGIGAWVVAGGLFGNERFVRAARREVRSALGPIPGRLRFASPARLHRLHAAVAPLPGAWMARRRQMVERMAAGLDLVNGHPNETALRLAYWRSGTDAPSRPLDPAGDGRGLLWFSPIVPMRADDVRRFVDLVTRVCDEHRMEPLVTLTSLSDRCFGGTVPLCFDREVADERARAEACHEKLVQRGREQGFVPYRAASGRMSDVVADTPYWRLVRSLKQAVDPANILAPGRYCLPGAQEDPAVAAGGDARAFPREALPIR
jgi:4-cresol dehydrogenase (hydroxylating)